jgi:hypothetical protein
MLACTATRAGRPRLARADAEMANLNYPVLVTIVLLLPMLYFGITSLAFFLRSFDDPIVTRLLRGLFGFCFLAASLCCAFGAAVFGVYGHGFVAVGLGAVAVCAAVSRRWFLLAMDAEFRARDAGDRDAPHRIRRLHVGGIAYNAVQLVVVFAVLPALVPAAT